MLTSLIYTLAALACVAHGTSHNSFAKIINKVYTFPDGRFLENIAVRSNGHLLLTNFAFPHVYVINPKATDTTPRIFIEIDSPAVNVTVGIAEYAPDKFAVIGALLNPSAFAATNMSVWTFDARHPARGPVKVADLPNAGLTNGVAALPGSPGVVLISDSILGAIWRVDLASGAVDIAAQDPTLAPVPGGLPLGINGLHVRNGTLFFINSSTGFLGKVPIAPDGAFLGSVAQLGVGLTRRDDFAIDREGSLWIAAHPDAIDVVQPDGSVTTITGFNDTAASVGPTSAAFGRGSRAEQKTLYITSGDGIVFAVNTQQVALPTA